MSILPSKINQSRLSSSLYLSMRGPHQEATAPTVLIECVARLLVAERVVINKSSCA